MRPREIVIYRHGRVRLNRGPKISSDCITVAAKLYDSAQVETGFPKETGFKPDLIIASNLKRSIDTAKRMFGRVDVVDPVFREAELPDLAYLPFKLRPEHWFAVSRASWLLGVGRNCEGMKPFRRRVAQASARLHELASQHERIVFVGHGVLNRYLARELRSLGYTGPAKPDWSHGRPNRFVFMKTQSATRRERDT